MAIAEFTEEYVPNAAYGLAPMQSGMLFQSLLAADKGGAGFDIEQIHIVLEEAIAAPAFAQAWTAVARRHAALSSSFRWEGVREPQQRANPDVVVPLTIEDWRGLDEVERARRRERFLVRDRARGFDLRCAPLMRVAVFRCDEDRCEVVWTVHHIVIDGRSMAPVLAEVFAAYEDALAGAKPAVAPVGASFRDVVEWSAGRRRQASLAFFKELLRGKTAPTPLPLAEPEARPLASTGVAEVHREVDETVRRAAHALTRQQHPRASMGGLAQAAWALVLSRLTGDLDVQFGTVRACRRGVMGGAAAHTVGLLMNTLPMRLCLDEDASVGELLDQVRGQNKAVREHEHTALVEVHALSELPPGTALFETLLMFDDRELNQQLQGLDAKWRSRRCTLHEQPPVPLTVTVFDGERLEVRVLYARARFRTPVAERITGYFVAALEGLVRAGAQGRLADVDILPPDERRRLLREWNDTARAFPEDLRIHQLFEQRVALQPDAVALECAGVSLTYAELEARANRLGHALVARGAKPGVYIGVCLPRGLDLVVALLAVAKSGAAYVPLDPEYPADRLAFMVADARAQLVVVDQRHRSLFETPALVLDGDDAASVSAMPSACLPCPATSADACYAIYTSGSTGRPKGVVLTHRAVLNTLDWVNRTCAVAPGDRLLFVTSPSFDLSVYDLFGALGAGATVVVATTPLLRDPQALARAVVEQRITVWDSAPAALQALVPFFRDALADGGGERLRLVMVSGDWVPIGLPGALKRAFPGVEVFALGGATEAAIWSNSFRIDEIDPRWTSIPYGRPIQNARYHVLDTRMRPVAPGVAGDLYIGGACLAQGYLARSELTAERFVRDPFEGPPERLYKTGDRARYFDDGNLEFLGRADFQVKIRGFRVELGEVEAALSALPGVREARCTAHTDASGQKALTAYVVTQDGVALDEAGIKERLAETLPAFMVPSRIGLVAAMPLSSNGKVDRGALPPLTTRTEGSAFVAPRTEREVRLAGVWRSLLRVERVSADDNFFALGGDSLLAVMLVVRVATEFGVALPLAGVLQHPTLEKLAASIDALLDQRPSMIPLSGSRHIVTLNHGGARPPLVLVSGIGGIGFAFHGLAASLGDAQPLHVVNAIGAEDPSEGFEHTIEQMAEIYEPEILEACPEGPIVLGGYSFGILVAFELAHRIRRKGRPVPLLVSFDGPAPGFPKLLPGFARVQSHLRALFTADAEARNEYVRERMVRLRGRLYGRFGRPEEGVAPMGVTDVEMDRRLRRVVAGLSRARGLYQPTQRDPADLLLIRTDIVEHWVGTVMDDPMYGWRSWVSGDVQMGMVPGAHRTMFHGANQARITELVSMAIERSSNARS